MHTDASFGIVPVRHDDDARRYLVVQQRKGHWGFPKGHAEGDEAAVDAALRELAEETGLADIRVLEDSRMSESYVFTKKSGRRVRKTVTYFVGVVDGEVELTPQPEEILACEWMTAGYARRTITFPESRDLLDRAERYLDSLDSVDVGSSSRR